MNASAISLSLVAETTETVAAEPSTAETAPEIGRALVATDCVALAEALGREIVTRQDRAAKARAVGGSGVFASVSVGRNKATTEANKLAAAFRTLGVSVAEHTMHARAYEASCRALLGSVMSECRTLGVNYAAICESLGIACDPTVASDGNAAVADLASEARAKDLARREIEAKIEAARKEAREAIETARKARKSAVDAAREAAKRLTAK